MAKGGSSTTAGSVMKRMEGAKNEARSASNSPLQSLQGRDRPVVGAPRVLFEKKCEGLWSDVTSAAGMAVFILSFCVLAPILALGWLAVPFAFGAKGMAVCVVLYTASQTIVPKWYSRAYKDGPIHAPIINTLVSYVRDFKVIKEADLDPSHNYVFAWHPHGRMFYGFGALIGLFSSWYPEIIATGHDVRGCVNENLLRIPLLGHWLHLIGLISCNKGTVRKVLSRGDSAGIIVGGIEEVLEGTFDDKDVLFLKERKGFCKLAMEGGSGVVPCYCFGESDLFHHEGEASLRFWRWLNKFSKVGVPFPVRGWMQTPFPKRAPLLIVLGSPLFAAEGESVAEFHARYVDALTEMHKRYVGMSSKPNRRLVIV